MGDWRNPRLSMESSRQRWLNHESRSATGDALCVRGLASGRALSMCNGANCVCRRRLAALRVDRSRAGAHVDRMQRTGNVRRAWYLLVLVPAAFAVGSAIQGAMTLLDAIEDMPRVVVPGSDEVVLDVGDTTLFGEYASPLLPGGVTIGSLELGCKLNAVWDGTPVALVAPSSQVTYRLSRFAGSSMFTASIPAYGTYRLSCEGSGGPATIAFGQGLGMLLVLVVVRTVGGALVAAALFLGVRRVRSRPRARAGALDPESVTPPEH